MKRLVETYCLLPGQKGRPKGKHGEQWRPLNGTGFTALTTAYATKTSVSELWSGEAPLYTQNTKIHCKRSWRTPWPF